MDSYAASAVQQQQAGFSQTSFNYRSSSNSNNSKKSTDEHDPNEPQLSRKILYDRLMVEAKLNRKGFRVIHYYATIFLFVYCIVTHDPVGALGDVHRSLAQRYDVKRLDKMNDVYAVMDYLEFFKVQTYKMASAMIDANTFDTLDPARCFDQATKDVCQLKFWSIPDEDPAAPNFVNFTEVFIQGVGRLGHYPERPIVLEHRMDYYSPMVAPLAPVVWQNRAKRTPCSGFGRTYNEEILGAGRCPVDGDCPAGTPVTSVISETGDSTVYVNYIEPAFFCVDHGSKYEVFYDRSWYPGVSYKSLKKGKPMKPQVLRGENVFYKFFSNIAYLQAPIKYTVDGQTIKPDDPMWADYHADRDTNPKRARWNDEYLADKDNRKNTFITLETKSLTVASIVIMPQGEKMPDITTIAMATFRFSSYGTIDAEMEFHSTSQTFASWKVAAGIFWFIALLNIVDNGVRHFNHWNDPTITVPKFIRISDVVLPLAASVTVFLTFLIDILPPHIDEDLAKAFRAHSEEEFFKVISTFINYADTHLILRKLSFFTCVLFVLRAVMQLEFHPRFGLILTALDKAKSDIWHIILACLPIFIIMAFQAYWMFAATHNATGFDTIFSAFRTTLTYVMPGIPGNFRSQDTTMFILWGITGLFVLRLFYLVTIASIVKAFMTSKDAMGDTSAHKDIQADALDAFAMLLHRQKNNWPTPHKLARLMHPDLEERLKLGKRGKPNAVRPDEIACLTGMSQPEAKAMLHHYANKVLNDHGMSKLVERDPNLRFPRESVEPGDVVDVTVSHTDFGQPITPREESEAGVNRGPAAESNGFATGEPSVENTPGRLPSTNHVTLQFSERSARNHLVVEKSQSRGTTESVERPGGTETAL